MEKTKKAKTEEFDIKEIYTPLSVAKKEIWRRWNDKELRKKVEDFLGGDVPKFLKKEPRAVIVRQVMSPNIEISCFLELAKCTGLKPLMGEYIDDKFVSINSYKLSLGKLSFFEKMNKKMDPILRNIRIIDVDNSENKKFSKIKTTWGEGLVDFHHKMLKSSYPDIKSSSLVDLSSWCKSHGGRAQDYYRYFLVWFICNGILFENFVPNKSEGEFTKKVLLPALKKIDKDFGLKPLIVPIINDDDVEDIFWRCYDKKSEENFHLMSAKYLGKNLIKKENKLAKG